MKDCVIFASMPVGEWARSYIEAGSYLVAVDAGWQNARALGLTPQLVLGDFDSAPPPAIEGVQLTPAEKDDTDTMLAVKQAVGLGMRRVTILGGLGGRFDHSYANTQALLYLAQKGVQNLLAASGCEIRCIGPGVLRLPARRGCYLSVFAVGGTARGVYLRGVKYPLVDATLLPDTPLGVSNEFAPGSAQAEVECREGYLLVMLVEKD